MPQPQSRPGEGTAWPRSPSRLPLPGGGQMEDDRVTHAPVMVGHEHRRDHGLTDAAGVEHPALEDHRLLDRPQNGVVGGREPADVGGQSLVSQRVVHRERGHRGHFGQPLDAAPVEPGLVRQHHGGRRKGHGVQPPQRGVTPPGPGHRGDDRAARERDQQREDDQGPPAVAHVDAQPRPDRVHPPPALARSVLPALPAGAPLRPLTRTWPPRGSRPARRQPGRLPRPPGRLAPPGTAGPPGPGPPPRRASRRAGRSRNSPARPGVTPAMIVPEDGFRHQQVPVGDADIHVVEAGDPGAPPFVFLHGWPESSRTWAQIMTLAAGSVRAIAIDLPGVGESAGAATDGSKRQIAGVVDQFLSVPGADRGDAGGSRHRRHGHLRLPAGLPGHRPGRDHGRAAARGGAVGGVRALALLVPLRPARGAGPARAAGAGPAGGLLRLLLRRAVRRPVEDHSPTRGVLKRPPTPATVR